MRMTVPVVLSMFVVGSAAADFQTSSWQNSVQIDDSLDGTGALPSHVALSQRGASASSSLTGVALEYAHVFSLSTYATEGGSASAFTFQAIEFEVDAPTPVYAHGLMDGAGSFNFFWSLSIQDPDTLEFDQLTGEFLSSDPDYAFFVSSAVFVLQPGEVYRFSSGVDLLDSNVAGGGEMYLTALVPNPQSALLGILGLAIIGLRRNVIRSA